MIDERGDYYPPAYVRQKGVAMIPVYSPSVPFGTIRLPPEGDGAWKVVVDLTEDQARYALWATLCILMGSPLSNAPEVLEVCGIANEQSMREAHLILAQIGVGRSHPEIVERLAQNTP